MPLKMLVIDDDESILFAMREYFQMLGYEVDCAKEKEEAEASLVNFDYSVILVDLRLGGTDRTEGLDIAVIAREHCPEAKIIVLTAYGTAEIEMRARCRGVDAFLHKPKPLPDLERIVSELVGSQS